MAVGSRPVASGAVAARKRIIVSGGGPTPKTVTPSAVGTSDLTQGLELSELPSIGATGTASLSMQLELSVAGSMSATGTPAVNKLVDKAISLIATAASTVQKTVEKGFSYASTGLLSATQGIVVEVGAACSAMGSLSTTALYIEFGTEVSYSSRATTYPVTYSTTYTVNKNKHE